MIAGNVSESVTMVNGAGAITSQSFAGYKLIAIASTRSATPSGGLTAAENTALTARAADIASHINGGGGLFGLTQAGLTGKYGYLGSIGGGVTVASESYSNVTATTAGMAVGITDTNMDVSAWHDTYATYPSFLTILAYRAGTTRVVALGGANFVIPRVINLTPPTAENNVNTTHTVTATIFDDSPPVAADGVDVVFEVISGPNIGDSGSATTSGGGMATFTWLGDGGQGLDTIEACFIDHLSVEQCTTALKNWIGGDSTPPVTVKTFTTPTHGMWNNGDVVLVFSATDDSSGVKEIVVVIDDGSGPVTTTLPATGGTITLSADGHYTVTFWAVDNNDNVETAQSQMQWIDSTAPLATCDETVNSSGKNVPKAGKNAGKSGQNPDGYYELGASDGGSGLASLVLSGTGSAAVFGFAPGTSIKLTQASGATPNVKPGAGDTDWKVQLKGDGVLIATDLAGNTTMTLCLVPKPPK